VLKRIAELGDDVRESYNRLVQAGYPSSTAEKIATGELPMDSASKAARMQEQGYTIPQFHGTYASDFTEVDPGMVDLGLHSGSFEQAVQRLRNTTDPLGGKSYGDFGYREGANVMPLVIKAENPLEMRDVGDWMNSVQVLEGMVGNPKLANRRDELESLYEEATELQSQFEGGDFLEESFRFSQDNRELLDYLKDMLREEGYDSIRYKNEVENAYGSQSALRPTAEQERRELSEQIRRLENTAMERAPQPPDPDDPLAAEKMREFLDAARSPSSYMTEDELARIESLKDRYREIGADPDNYNDPTSYISLEEENVRSVNAAFDPDQRRNPNILAGLGATGVGAGLLFAPQESEASVLGEIGKRLVRNTSDASNIFGEGAEQITLSDPVSGGRIKLLSRPGEPNSVLNLYVDEEFRGQGVGKALQDAALAEGPLMGQVSSKAAAVNAYRSGRRPIGNPNASLEDVFAAIDEDSSVNMVTSDLLPSGKGALGAGALGLGALAAPQDALAAEQGGAMDEIDIFEQFSQLSPEAEALLSRSAEGMVMTPGGPVRADAGPTEAQALNFAGLMTGVGGVLDLLGLYPQMPEEGVGFGEMIAGETNPSLLENLQQGNYLDTGLQLLGAIPLVGAAAKAPRMLSRAELAEFKNVLTQAIERQDPNLRQLIDEHPTVVAAQARLSEIPETVDNPLYNTEEWVQNRQFIFGSGDGARVVTGYDNAVDELHDHLRRFAWEDDNIPYPGPMKTEGPKTAVIVLGPAAAGKSTIANPIARKINATIIDADEAKKVLPEYEGGVGANAVHQESQAIASLVEQEAIKEGDNLVIGTIGDKPDKIRARISALKDAGYNVQLVDVVVPAEEAAIRMYNRFASTGRILPASKIRSVGDKPTQTYNLLREEGIADGYTRIDNSGAFDQPKPVREDTGKLLQGTELRLRFEGGAGGNGRPVSRNAGRAPAGAGASSEAKRGIGSLNLD